MYEYTAVVIKVVDGDTLDLNIDLGLRVYTVARCRLVGIDAPERNTASGQDTLRFLQALLPVGSDVLVRTNKDKKEKYGRWLAQVFRHGSDINAKLVNEGYARSWDGRGPGG